MLGLSSHPRLGLSTREIERRLPHLRGEAARLSGEAAKIGTDTLLRLSHEVEHRPLATIAVAVGVGILVGLMMNRR